MTLESFLRRVVGIVERVDVAYMLTGSLAAAYYATPRATRDVDLVIAVTLDEVGVLVEELDDAGFYVDLEAAREAVRQQGQFNAIDPDSGWKVDWIVRRNRPFSIEEFERRRRVETMGLVLPMVTPEDLIVAKLEWARMGASELQLRDAAAILAEHGHDLDRDHLERWIEELGLGREWEQVCEETDQPEAN